MSSAQAELLRERVKAAAQTRIDQINRRAEITPFPDMMIRDGMPRGSIDYSVTKLGRKYGGELANIRPWCDATARTAEEWIARLELHVEGEPQPRIMTIAGDGTVHEQIGKDKDYTPLKILVVFGILCGILFVGGLVKYIFLSAAVRWPTVAGTVSGVSMTKNFDAQRRTHVYAPLIVYYYVIDGREYQCDRYDLAQVYGSEMAAKQVMARHPPGTPVKVHYDPTDPGRAALDVRIQPLHYFFVALPLLVFVAFAGCTILWFMDVNGMIGSSN